MLLGMITATFGGLKRDVLCNEIPLIFRIEIYAIPCLFGAAVYLFGDDLGFIGGYLVTDNGSCNYYNSDTCNYKFLENTTDQRTGSTHE